MSYKTFLATFFISLSTLAININAAGPNQASRFFINNGGLLDRTSPLVIPEKNATALNNVTLDTRGQLQKRSDWTQLNTSGALGSSIVTGGDYHTATSGNNFFALVVGTDVYRTANTFNGTYSKITGTVIITAGNSNLAQTTSINDALIFCNDLDKPFYVTDSGNATTISTNTISAAKTCSVYGNYWIPANTTESSTNFPSRVRWSDINNQNSLPANNYIDVEPNDGDSIVSVISYEDAVYIFKKRSIYKMLITGLDGADAFIIRPVARNIGAWSKNSVRVIPNVGITFLAQNNLYTLSGNYNEVYQSNGISPIGDPIQRTFDGLSRAMWGQSIAAVYPKRFQYWLAVSTNGTSNSEVLVYDYIQKAWTTYTGIQASMLSQAEDSTGASLLMSGDYGGNHYKQDVANMTHITAFSYTTPDYTLDMPEFTKNFKYLYLFFNVVESTTTVEAAFDYQSTFEYSSQVSLGQTGAVYDTAIYDVDVYPSVNYKVARIELNRSARAIKLRFTESSVNSYGIIGWALVWSPEDWRQ